jgi:hypothetical protein
MALRTEGSIVLVETADQTHPEVVWEHAGKRVLVTDSISYASREHAGHVVVCGSHGGTSAGEYARDFGLAAVVCNDAGIGKNDAGVAGLRLVEAHGIVGIAVGHGSARIGDGRDAWDHGVVSFVNKTAAAHGVRRGHPVKDEIARLLTQWGTAC